MSYLANIITGLGLLSAFLSIIFSLEGHFTFASWAIIMAVIFDGLDGQVARRQKIRSEFGKEFDSLVDAISFGVAPTVLGYIFVYSHFHLWTILPLFFYLLFSVARLARFNITPKDKASGYFYGLPTTASGGILASFILIHRKYGLEVHPAIFVIMVLLLAFLMISQVRYLNLSSLNKVPGKIMYLFLSVAFVGVVIFPEITAFALFIIYLVFSPFVVKSFIAVK